MYKVYEVHDLNYATQFYVPAMAIICFDKKYILMKQLQWETIHRSFFIF